MPTKTDFSSRSAALESAALVYWRIPRRAEKSLISGARGG
jgi:hypothetical protein